MSEVISDLYTINEDNSSNDYVGFTFNGIHSSELGIVRTSDGSRFNENLLPTLQDKTVPVPGGDGAYFFGTYYTQRQFNIQFAFDEMTEKQLVKLKKWLGDKKIHELIFDETPYKAYKAKITGSAVIKYIPFSEGATNRVYKGEGSIQFTAYFPFARSVHKFLKDYNVSNLKEWQEASGMKINGYSEDANVNSYPIDSYISNFHGFYVYNPGDIEADFILSLKFNNNEIASGSIYMNIGSEQLNFNKIVAKGTDAGIQINTKLNLIEGIDNSGRKTGTIYNDCIIAGNFFKIPQIGPEDNLAQLFVDLSSGAASNCDPQIEYDYYYI